MNTEQKKAELRRKAASFPKTNADRLLERFLNLPQVQGADTVMVFCGVGREPDTSGLIRALLEQGKRVALPVCLPQRKLEARAITDLSELAPNRYGIPEPDGLCPIVPKSEIGAMLVPNIMCDREGYRLGHGGGYYDRWLADYQGFTAAVCPPEQLVERLPRDESDVPVQMVIWE